MDHAREIVELDGRRFAVRRVQGPGGRALAVERPPADDLVLPPWTLGDHLAALDRHAYLEGQRPRVDLAGLAREVLARAAGPELADDDLAALAPLALWWAYDQGRPVPSDTPPAVRPWTSLERARALDDCTDPRTLEVRAGALLRAMVLASAGDRDPLALSGEPALALLDAVADVNGPPQDMSEGPGSAELARATLRLCGALGWTPSQVWSAPAPEVDRLLALLARLEAPAPARARPTPPQPQPSSPAFAHSRLAAYADAVIIDLSPG